MLHPVKLPTQPQSLQDQALLHQVDQVKVWSKLQRHRVPGRPKPLQVKMDKQETWAID